MTNPVRVTIPTPNTWTLVASNVTNAFVYRLDTTAVLRYTYRDTGDPAPSGMFAADSAIGVQDIGLEVSNSSPVDIYLQSDRVCDVRVDVGSGGGGGISGTVQVEGDTTHDAVDTGDPVKIGAVARAIQQTAVTDGDRVDLVASVNGELVLAGFDWTTLALRILRANPDSANNVVITIPTITVASGGTDSTSAIFAMGDYGQGLTLDIRTSGAGTPGITLQGNNVSDSAGDFVHDLTQYGFTSATSATAASYAGSVVLHANRGSLMHYYRLTLTATGGDVNYDIAYRRF